MENYKSHFNQNDFYDQTLFNSRVLQTAELNEIEEKNQWARSSLYGSLIKDGSLFAHDVKINENTLKADISFYYRGFVRKFIGEISLEDHNFPLDVYIKPKEEVIGSLADPDHLSPNRDEDGAARLKLRFDLSFEEGIFLFRIAKDGSLLIPSPVKRLNNQFITNENVFTVGEFGDYPDLHTALSAAKTGDVLHVVSDQYTDMPYIVDINLIEIRLLKSVKIAGSSGLWDLLKPRCLFDVEAGGLTIKGGGSIGCHGAIEIKDTLFKVASNCTVIVSDIFYFGFKDITKTGEGQLVRTQTGKIKL